MSFSLPHSIRVFFFSFHISLTSTEYLYITFYIRFWNSWDVTICFPCMTLCMNYVDGLGYPCKTRQSTLSCISRTQQNSTEFKVVKVSCTNALAHGFQREIVSFPECSASFWSSKVRVILFQPFLAMLSHSHYQSRSTPVCIFVSSRLLTLRSLQFLQL